MDFQDTRTEVTTKIQNGVDDISDSQDALITAFDSLENIHNSDSDNGEIVTKTITYTHHSIDISGDPEYNPEVNTRITTHSRDSSPETDWQIRHRSEHGDSSYLGETVDDAAVDDFFSVPDEDDITEQRITMRSEEANRPYGGGLAVTMDPPSHSSRSSVQDDTVGDNGYEPPEVVHGDIHNGDVLFTSEVRTSGDNLSENNANEDNEFPEFPDFESSVVNVAENANIDNVPHAENDDEIVGTVQDKVDDVRTLGLEYVGDTAHDKLNDISNDGVVGKVKGEIVEHNAIDTVKDKLTKESDSDDDDSLVDNVKDKIASSGVLGSVEADLSIKPKSSIHDDSEQHGKSEDDSILIREKNSVSVESEPPVLELDTMNALEDDDMDYELQEVDISESHDEDFGKVFAEHRQSMREGNTTPLFHQDASRFVNNNIGTLKSEITPKATKPDKEKNGSSYTINSMPTDEDRSKKGCVGILKSMFCPKRGSWQPDSCY